MPLINRTYFTGMLSIAQSEGAVKDLLDMYIAQYEPEWLVKYLGYAFSQLVIADADQRMHDLILGKTYTYNDKEYRWDGITYIINDDVRFSPIANYIYWHFIGDNATNIGGIGGVNTNAENAQRVSPIRKQITAWNKMCDMVTEMREYLHRNADIYPEYDKNLVVCNERQNEI